jgi:hypothetical protein
MNAHEIDERAVFIKGQAGYLAFVVMSFVLAGEMAAAEWMPNLLTWNGFPAGYFVPILIGGSVYYGYSILHKTFGAGTARTIVIAFAVGFVLAAALALTRQHLF